jgi:hypothetical protein
MKTFTSLKDRIILAKNCKYMLFYKADFDTVLCNNFDKWGENGRWVSPKLCLICLNHEDV